MTIKEANEAIRNLGRPTPAKKVTKKLTGKLKKVSLVRPKKQLPKGAMIIKIRCTLPGQTPLRVE
jgi:hypothetical protein